MDQDNQKQTVDGVKNSDTPVSTVNNSIDGFAAARPSAAPQPSTNNVSASSSFVPSSTQNTQNSSFSSAPGFSSGLSSPLSNSDNSKKLDSSPEGELIKLRANNKALKVWLVVFIVVFVAALAGLIVYFVLHSQTQAKLNDSQQKNAALQKKIDDTALNNEKQQAGSTQTQLTQVQTQLTTAQGQVKTLTAQNTTANANVTTLQTYITSLTATATQLKTTCGTACASITIPPVPSLAK